MINGTKWWTSGAMDPRCQILVLMVIATFINECMLSIVQFFYFNIKAVCFSIYRGRQIFLHLNINSNR